MWHVPFLGKNIWYCIKKLYISNFFPPRCLFSLLCDKASTASFSTKNILQKSYFSPAIQPYYWLIFLNFFQRMKNQQKNGLGFYNFQMTLVFWILVFLKILKVYSCSVQKELSIDIKISYTLIFASLSFPASCVIQEMEEYISFL